MFHTQELTEYACAYLLNGLPECSELLLLEDSVPVLVQLRELPLHHLNMSACQKNDNDYGSFKNRYLQEYAK